MHMSGAIIQPNQPITSRTEPPIEEPEPDVEPVEEPDFPEDPGPAEDPEEQPIEDTGIRQ
jgi:hypothetical protein